LRPCRGRNATRRPPTSPMVRGAEVAPYGVSIVTSSTSSRKQEKPDPPKTPTSAWATDQSLELLDDPELDDPELDDPALDDPAPDGVEPAPDDAPDEAASPWECEWPPWEWSCEGL